MPTESATASTTGIVLPAFEDGLGRRYRPVTHADNAPPEILCFRHELTDVPAFEFSLRERVARLAEFRHPSYARIRKVDRLSDERGTVALMSDCAPGTRLSEMLGAAERGGPILSLPAALCLVRQLAPGLALLHKQTGVANGAIAPERLIVTPQARLFIVEHVIGAALEQLRYSRERYWRELRVALPVSVGLPRFDEHADVTQLGVVALSLILGRPLHDDEYPGLAEDLVGSACARTPSGGRESLSPDLRDWLRRALQLDVRHSFRSLSEAQNALDQLVSVEGKHHADLSDLETFLASYHDSMRLAPPVPKPNVATDGAVRRSEGSMETLRPLKPLNPEPLQPEPFRPEPLEPEPFQDDSADDLEDWQPAIPSRPKKNAFGRREWVAAGLIGTMAVGGGLVAAWRGLRPAALPVTTGTMTVDTHPSGGKVEVDGVERGLTPLTLSLPAGAHTLVVRGAGEPRTIPITIAAGAQMSQYVELPVALAASGNLEIRTEPNGARVSVDGVSRGIAPVMVPDLSPGEHTIKLENDLGSVSQSVRIEPGVTNSLVVPLNAPQGAPASGWVSVSAPFDMEIYEQGRLLGNSGIDRIMMPAGKHDIEIVNNALGYREARTMQVAPGRVTNISVSLPKGTVSLNAIPWASVSIDGESVGDTPIGNLSIAIGPHEVVFRNPQLGEQRRVITVTQSTPIRFSIDLTKK